MSHFQNPYDPSSFKYGKWNAAKDEYDNKLRYAAEYEVWERAKARAAAFDSFKAALRNIEPYQHKRHW